MAASSRFVLRSDDGLIYGVAGGQAAPSSNSPNNREELTSKLGRLPGTAKKSLAGLVAPLICFFALPPKAGRPTTP